MTDTIETRVARGVALLDEVRPGWWRESVPEPYAPIDLDRLDLASCENCAVAQFTGECYEDAVLRLVKSFDGAVDYGFTLADDRGELFDDLTAEWRKVIEARRSGS